MLRTLSVKEIVHQIGAQHRDKQLMKILEELDRDGSGQIDVAELVNLLEDVRRGRKERKYMCFAIVAMFVFGIVLIGSIIGLTYAMLYSLKDTEVKGGVMFVKKADGTAGDLVRIGSAEFSVLDGGAMVQRSVAANSSPSVLRTASFMGTPQSLTSEIDIEELLELKYLLINGTGKAQLGLMVQGVARVPLQGSIYGTVVHVITAAGTITLDGSVITFSTAIANIFAEAGFRVSSTRRALLGSYAVLGFFNTIKDLSAAGNPAGQPEPKFPSKDFVMKLKIYQPCITPDQPDTDRCTYAPPQTPVMEDDSPPPEAPVAPLPPMMPPSSGQDTTGNATRRALWEEPSVMRGASSRRRLRHLWVATAPAVHSGDEQHSDHNRALSEEFAVDLAGVELYRGSRYMTHNETTISYGGNIRVMYDFAIYPLWQKIEVLSGKTVYSWQENVLPEGSNNEVHQYFCGNYSAATTGAAGVDASSVLNYTYNGVDSLGDRLARHFELNVLQLLDKSGKTEVMRVDYWDTLDTYTPLRFEFTHKSIGTVMIDVIELRSIDASSPEADATLFDIPALQPDFICPNNPRLPRLSSPFMVRGATVPVDVPAGADNAAGRRLVEQSVALAAQWNSLDHAHGTGDWPQWALDMYGGVHPAKTPEAAARRMLGSQCGTTVSISADVKVCSVEYKIYTKGAFGVSVGCSKSFGPIELSGNLELDSCDMIVKGCLGVAIGLPDDNWLVKKIGIDLSIDIASVCVGYNIEGKFFFIEASLTLDLLVFKAELSMEMDFSSCCVWIASVNLEASVGIGFLGLWVTVGDIDIISDVYLKGSAKAQEQTENPKAINLATTTWLTVGEGLFGNWDKASYPCGKFSYNQRKSVMELTGLPINSFQLRMEPDQGSGGDDTALNGLSVGCMSGMSNVIHDGVGYWGSWTASKSCTPGGYFVGAKMRIEALQNTYTIGGLPSKTGDDTAANSIVFTCSNDRGTELNAHSGFWGSWTGWTYCPGETYICGLQLRIASPGGDDTALNGLRIACCNFPTSSETALTSTGKIRTQHNVLVLDVPENVTLMVMQQWLQRAADDPRQLFTITTTPTGAYIIKSTTYGYCLAAQNKGTTDGTVVALEGCVAGARHQTWAIVPVGYSRFDFADGKGGRYVTMYTLSPTHASKLCMEIYGGYTINAVIVQLLGCNNQGNQRFWMDLPTRATTGNILALAGENNRCLNFRVQSIESSECTDGAASQTFTITAIGTNAYQIRSQSGLCIMPYGANSFSGTVVTLASCESSELSQIWKASAGYNGGVSFSPYHVSGMCLEVKGSSTTNGASIQMSWCNGNKGQSWKAILPVA